MNPQEPRPVRVLLVDDHEIVRVGLRAIFAQAGIEVVGEASTAAEAIEEAARLDPDVVLMDVRLPDGSGVTACREIRAANPRVSVLFLTAFADDGALLATAFATAGGYLPKEIGAANLIQAVKSVASGLSVLDPSVVHRIMEGLRTLGGTSASDTDGELLSKQERRVLALVAEGKTNKEIAAELGLSPKTVKNYLSTVFEKLQVNRRSAAVARMIRGE
jgi:DNA-binding NarL/FixJ family response regulator